MAGNASDRWHQWLMNRRAGGDPERMRAVLTYLAPIRDRVLDHAALRAGETLLDVGCGDGLIGFGALARTADAAIIFSDISADLLREAEHAAEALGFRARCRFVQTAAEQLDLIADASVDVVTTRSVLIYVADKTAAFHAFRRVLRPGGRISLFEPVNRFAVSDTDDRLWGYDVGPIAPVAAKLRALFRRYQPLESDPMLDFDERDLLRSAEMAGFRQIRLELQVTVATQTAPTPWETWVNTAWNPELPSVAEALAETLNEVEAATFTAHMRPLLESGAALRREAVAYLWAQC